jgi:hypothetical protein
MAIVSEEQTSVPREDDAMPIRSYQPGDEAAQVRIYNQDAGSLPGFKPATPEEVARRYAADPDSGTRYYAVENGGIVGYAVFGSNGRVSYPWCLPGAETWREPLLEAVLAVMRQRGLAAAWAAYRADWSPVLDFFRQHDFAETRRMVNYVAEVSRLPSCTELPPDRVIEPLKPAEVPRLLELAPELFPDADPSAIGRFYGDNPFHDFSRSLVALKDAGSGEMRGAGLLVVNDRFADPTKIDAAMPCFRLGALGTESERHKRVNGLFSAAFRDESEGELLLAWLLGTRARQVGLTLIAAQVPTDAPALCAWYDRYFQRQGSFPIVSRRLVT